MVVEAGTDRDIETAFATFAQRAAIALFIGSYAFFNSRRERVAALAVRHALPAAYSLREFATAGGLMLLLLHFAPFISPSRQATESTSAGGVPPSARECPPLTRPRVSSPLLAAEHSSSGCA